MGGVAVDILVTTVVMAGVGAARALAVRSGRLSLAAGEAAGGQEAAFQRIFTPDIDPAGWGKTTAKWLRWVDELLTADLARR